MSGNAVRQQQKHELIKTRTLTSEHTKNKWTRRTINQGTRQHINQGTRSGKKTGLAGCCHLSQGSFVFDLCLFSLWSWQGLTPGSSNVLFFIVVSQWFWIVLQTKTNPGQLFRGLQNIRLSRLCCLQPREKPTVVNYSVTPAKQSHIKRVAAVIETNHDKSTCETRRRIVHHINRLTQDETIRANRKAPYWFLTESTVVWKTIYSNHN